MFYCNTTDDFFQYLGWFARLLEFRKTNTVCPGVYPTISHGASGTKSEVPPAVSTDLEYMEASIDAKSSIIGANGIDIHLFPHIILNFVMVQPENAYYFFGSMVVLLGLLAICCPSVLIRSGAFVFEVFLAVPGLSFSLTHMHEVKKDSQLKTEVAKFEASNALLVQTVSELTATRM